jgi:hypothetical protein
MVPNAFIVDDLGELLALQRVFREAKFCTEPDDVEVSDSPIVARMFERLIATLIAREVARDGEGARQRWMQWLAIDESRDEWHSAVRRARADDRWATFSGDERNSYIELLLSPFVVSPEVVEKFVRMVDQSKE